MPIPIDCGKLVPGSGCAPVGAPVFKTGGWLRRASSGGFDSHPLPPLFRYWVVPLGEMMQILAGGLSQILNVIKETINRLFGLADLVACLLGFMPWKKLRLRVVVLYGENQQPPVSKAIIAVAVAEAARVFEQVARVRFITTESGVFIQENIAPELALNVHCTDGAWQEDFGQTGAYFRKNSARNISGMLTGYGSPITVFIVYNISGKGGCSLGPLTDYVTQSARTLGKNRLMAHEIAHACGLWHSKEKPNLMFPRSPGDLMSRWQVAILRNSRHITYF